MPDPQLPNLIIAGVNKAGTTSLYAYLAQHPAIGASAIKETCHFLPLRYGEPMPGIEAYREQFKAVTDKPVRFESTPGYFYGGQRLIDGLCESLGDDLKIILIFREPVSRLVSFFNFKKSTLELRDDLTLAGYFRWCQALENEDLRQRLNNKMFGLQGGKYADYLPPWIETFGDRLKVLFTDDLNRHPREVLRQVCTFVGVDPEFVERIDLARSNKSTHFRLAGVQRLALSMNKAGESFWRAHPKLKRSLRDIYYKINGRPFEPADDPETIQALHAFYEPYNARLADQLRAAGYHDLPGWLTPQPKGGWA
jgi:hypothetical protein